MHLANFFMVGFETLPRLAFSERNDLYWHFVLLSYS